MGTRPPVAETPTAPVTPTPTGTSATPEDLNPNLLGDAYGSYWNKCVAPRKGVDGSGKAFPDVQGTLDAVGNAVVYIWTTSLGNAWAEFLLIIAVVAQFFCGTASVTSASRMMFAFSRDRAVPGSTLWRKVARNRVPVNAVIAIGVLSWLIVVPSLFSAIAYLVATSIAVIGLNIAFALPIILRIKAGGRFESGAWSLGRHYRWISPLAVAWIAFICIAGILPVSPSGVPGAADFDWALFNYAPLVTGGVILAVLLWWVLSARHWFKGPKHTISELDRELGETPA